MTLKEYRKIHGLSMAAMAKLIGVKSPVSVFNYELGTIPRKKVLERINKATKGLVKIGDFYDK